MRPFPALFASPAPIAPSTVALSDDEVNQMTNFLRRLVQTPSPYSREGAVAELIKQELEAVGVADVSSDAAGSIFARLGNGIGPTLLLDAHMDTVEPTDANWVHGPYMAAIENGLLYGLGAAD